jgi:hypothetical protein
LSWHVRVGELDGMEDGEAEGFELGTSDG